MQKNWIGKSSGLEVDFRVEGMDGSIRIFTTRPDTLFGATFLCLSPNHPLSAKLVSDKAELEKIIAHYGKEDEKIGLNTGRLCINLLMMRRYHLCCELCSDGIRHRRYHVRACT